MSKNYKLKVRKIPLDTDISYEHPRFSTFGELHLDLLENKNKLKKNAPKPVYTREPSPRMSTRNTSDGGNDFTIEDLERAYNDLDDNELIDSDFGTSTPVPPTEQKEKPTSVQQPPETPGESDEERELREKSELLFKFMVLKKQYQNIEIPEFTEYSDLGNMKRVYDQIIRRVSLDSSVDNYRQYLSSGFYILEWVATNFLGIDLSGYSAQQTSMMNKYETLLVELGEKNYSVKGSRFPVEVRLVFYIIFNAGLFYIQKMIFSNNPDSNIFSSMFGGGAPSKPPQSRPKKQRMRGPTISPEEVENMNKTARQNPEQFESDSD